MSLDNLKYAGKLHVTLRDENGNVKDYRKVDNAITNLGLDYLIKTTMDSSLTAMTVFYIGSTASAGAAAAADTTAATSENFRLAFTYATGATVGRGSATATFGASGAGGDTTTGIREAGIFNGLDGANSGDGILFARALFTAVNKGESDSLEIKWDISYS